MWISPLNIKVPPLPPKKVQGIFRINTGGVKSIKWPLLSWTKAWWAKKAFCGIVNTFWFTVNPAISQSTEIVKKKAFYKKVQIFVKMVLLK